MERAHGECVAERVRDALESLARGGLTGIRHFATVIENGGTWLVSLLADGRCDPGKHFTVRMACTVQEERSLAAGLSLVRATPLVVTLTRSSDGEQCAFQQDLRLNPRSGAFRIDEAAVRSRFDEMLASLSLF